MNIVEQLKAAIDERQRALDADQGGGMCDADGGHWTEDQVRRHLEAGREILELHQVDYIAPAFNVYGLRVRDGWVCSVCSERVDGELQRCDGPACPTVILLARGYGIEVQ
jgi:hypothetical protein